MKTLLTTLSLILFSNLYSQWTYQTINNGFDDPYRIAYTAEDEGAFLKLENVEGRVAFYISGSYYCDDYPTCDFVFSNSTTTHKASLTGAKNDNSEIIFFTFDLMAEDSLFVDWFKKCSTLKIRVNETYCTSNYYEFNMSKSQSALNFIKEEK
jgi:hypothetical protein